MASANAKIQREQFYPEAVRRSGADSVTVRVRARFKIKRDGTIAGLSVSSEDPAFARAAEEAVRRAAPFGEFPDELTLPQLSASITLEYRLR